MFRNSVFRFWSVEGRYWPVETSPLGLELCHLPSWCDELPSEVSLEFRLPDPEFVRAGSGVRLPKLG